MLPQCTALYTTLMIQNQKQKVEGTLWGLEIPNHLNYLNRMQQSQCKWNISAIQVKKMKFTLFRTSPNLEKLRGSCFEEWWVRTGAGPTACIQNPEITRNYFKVCYCLIVPETHCSDSFATYWHSGWFSSVLDEWKGRTSLW